MTNSSGSYDPTKIQEYRARFWAPDPIPDSLKRARISLREQGCSPQYRHPSTSLSHKESRISRWHLDDMLLLSKLRPNHGGGDSGHHMNATCTPLSYQLTR